MAGLSSVHCNACQRHSREQSKYAYSVSLDCLLSVSRSLLPSEQHDFVIIISYPCFPLRSLLSPLPLWYVTTALAVICCFVYVPSKLSKCIINMHSASLMGKPCKCPRRRTDIKERVYPRVKYTQCGGEVEWGEPRRKESLDTKCHKHLFLDDATASRSSVQGGLLCGFMERTKPFTLRLHSKVKCELASCKPGKELIPSHMNHPQCRIMLPFHTLF